MEDKDYTEAEVQAMGQQELLTAFFQRLKEDGSALTRALGMVQDVAGMDLWQKQYDAIATLETALNAHQGDGWDKNPLLREAALTLINEIRLMLATLIQVDGVVRNRMTEARTTMHALNAKMAAATEASE